MLLSTAYIHINENNNNKKKIFIKKFLAMSNVLYILKIRLRISESF